MLGWSPSSEQSGITRRSEAKDRHVAERAGHRPPITHAWVALWLGLALLLAMMPAHRAQAAPFAAVVMDARTGEILHSVNDTARLHPASLTKMMTLYVAFEAIRNGEISLDTMVTVSRRAAAEPPSRLGLRAGQRIALRHLIRAAALRSGNDAATAIAEAVSGSVEAFAQRMTRTGQAMGMTQTTFRNAHGLTAAGHMSSARDMTILGRQLFFDFPEYYGIFSRRSEDAGIAQVTNTNSRFLDGYRGADGIKTGFTNAAGYNLTAMAERDGVRVIVTVFGGRSVQHRHEQVTQLMDRGFRAAPTRAAVRRPARPNYSRPTASASATAPARNQTPAPTESRAAGRVIRLQTAPARSVFPQRRPLPGEAPTAAPAPELLAALQTGIDAALAELADPDMPDEAPSTRERGAVARSPLPQTRPTAVLARATAPAPVAIAAAAPDPAAPVAADVEAARAAGFTVIDPETFAQALAAPDSEGPEAEDATTQALALADVPAPSAPADAPPALPARALAPPAERPAALAHAQPAPPDSAEPALAALDDPAADPGMTPAPQGAVPALPGPFGPTELAAVQVQDGLVVIPGLPPIPLAAAAPVLSVDPATQDIAAPLEAVTLPPAPPVIALDPAIEAATDPGLVVTAEGQILWRDEDLLNGLDRITPVPEGPSPIVLTTEDTPQTAAPPPQPVMTDMVVRVSTSGSQVWGVDLGRYSSRFDAERTLLRVALSESTTLSGGVRRVVERGGGYGALIVSLTQDQADRACLRLGTAAQPCTVLTP
jgi:D-alanyl-D-alanine carboxypeptidase